MITQLRVKIIPGIYLSLPLAYKHKFILGLPLHSTQSTDLPMALQTFFHILLLTHTEQVALVFHLADHLKRHAQPIT